MIKETHSYEVKLNWNYDSKGTISSPEIPIKIEVATPPDFPGGMKELWTPEHLFLASINACLMATFIAIASNSKMEFVSYESSAVGMVEKLDGKFIVTEITIVPKVVALDAGQEDRLRRIFEMSEKACAISNSIKSKINLQPVITLR